MGFVDQIINLQVSATLFEHEAQERDRDIKSIEKKATACIRKGDEDEARIHAQTAIRMKHERLEFKKIAATLNTTASQLETVFKMRKVTTSMHKTVQGLVAASQKMNPAKINRMMERFSKEMGAMQGNQGKILGSMGVVSADLTPEKEVNNVLSQLADAAGLELKETMQIAPPSVEPEAEVAEAQKEPVRAKPQRVAVASAPVPKRTKPAKKKTPSAPAPQAVPDVVVAEPAPRPTKAPVFVFEEEEEKEEAVPIVQDPFSVCCGDDCSNHTVPLEPAPYESEPVPTVTTDPSIPCGLLVDFCDPNITDHRPPPPPPPSPDTDLNRRMARLFSKKL